MVKNSALKKNKMEESRKRRGPGPAVKPNKRKRSSDSKPAIDDRLRQILTGSDDEEQSQRNAPAAQKSTQKDLRQLLNAKEANTAEMPISDLRALINGKQTAASSAQMHHQSTTDDDNDHIDDDDVVQLQPKSNNQLEGNTDNNASAHASQPAAKLDSPNSFSQWSKALSEAHASKINITVILENANLETVQHKGRSGGVVLLNCDDHRHILKKSGREPNDARPDITHQCLLALQDSPLNKAGRLKVYVRTAKNVLIDVHPQTRIPRTIKRFSGLMAELLEKFKVRGTSGSTPLLKVIRNPITSHLPVGARKVVCTYNTDNVVDIREHASQMTRLALPRPTGDSLDSPSETDIQDRGEAVNIVYIVGAMAHGKVTEDWADDNICVSEFPLSAATVCSRITYAYEAMLGIL